MRLDDGKKASHRNLDRSRGAHVESVVATGLVHDLHKRRDLEVHPIALGDALVDAPLLEAQLGSATVPQHVLANVHAAARTGHGEVRVALEGRLRADHTPFLEPLALLVILDSQSARLLVMIFAIVNGPPLRRGGPAPAGGAGASSSPMKNSSAGFSSFLPLPRGVLTNLLTLVRKASDQVGTIAVAMSSGMMNLFSPTRRRPL